MRSPKNKLYIPIVFSALFFFISISCKDSGITDPKPSILTKDNIEKLQAATDKIMMNKQTPGMMVYISVEGEGEYL